MILHIDTKDQKTIKVEIRDKQSLRSGDLKGKVISEMMEENEYGSQVLLPLIVKLLEKNKLEFEDLDEIEVSVGPGSFTGLKVGASVAQALGFALNIPVNGKLNKPVILKYT